MSSLTIIPTDVHSQREQLQKIFDSPAANKDQQNAQSINLATEQAPLNGKETRLDQALHFAREINTKAPDHNITLKQAFDILSIPAGLTLDQIQGDPQLLREIRARYIKAVRLTHTDSFQDAPKEQLELLAKASQLLNIAYHIIRGERKAAPETVIDTNEKDNQSQVRQEILQLQPIEGLATYVTNNLNALSNANAENDTSTTTAEATTTSHPVANNVSPSYQTAEIPISLSLAADQVSSTTNQENVPAHSSSDPFASVNKAPYYFGSTQQKNKQVFNGVVVAPDDTQSTEQQLADEALGHLTALSGSFKRAFDMSMMTTQRLNDLIGSEGLLSANPDNIDAAATIAAQYAIEFKQRNATAKS
jgi:hypothetical protein